MLGLPHCGGGAAPGGWWRRVFADKGEQATNEMLRRPGRKCDATAGLQHTAHLRDGYIWPGRKHVAELADDDIKLAIRERQTLGVSLKPLGGTQPGYSSILTRNVEQGRRQVESRH